MPRTRRTQERGRGPNIRQLSEMLGFTDAKALPKMLSDFWSPHFPHGRLSDATDQQIAKVADDFLEQKGSDLWSVRGRGPVYPDDKDKHIKPKIFEILKRQRRNQLDVRMKRDRRQPVGSEEPLGENDDIDHPEAGRASTVNSTEEVRENRRELNHSEADTATPAPALPLAQPASIPGASQQSGLPVAHQRERADTPNSLQAASSRAYSAPTVNPQKRGFEEMSADVSPAAPTVTTRFATSHKRLAPENAFRAQSAENEASSNYKRPTVAQEPPAPKSIRDQPTMLNATEPNKIGPVGQESAVSERNPRMINTAHVATYNNVAALSYRPAQPDDGIANSSPKNGYKDASQAREIDPSNVELWADSEQVESISYDIFQNNYSVDLNKMPGLLRFLLEYCEDNMIRNRQNMRDGLTAEDRSSARSCFFAFRDTLNALQEEGLRVGAHLNY